jgi:hypothetical protein
MKKQKPKKISKTIRLEELWMRKIYKNLHTNIPLKTTTLWKFPRLLLKSYISAKTFSAAGYPFIEIAHDQWSFLHKSLQENSIVYSWTGNIFWFRDHNDRNKAEKIIKDIL